MPKKPIYGKIEKIRLSKHEKYFETWQWVQQRAFKKKISISLCVEQLLERMKNRARALGVVTNLRLLYQFGLPWLVL